jgi:hypothetical protein
MAERKNRSRMIFTGAALVPTMILIGILNFHAAKDLPRLQGGGEILARDFIVADDPELMWTSVPNLDHFPHGFFKVPISTNAEGFRTHPFTRKGDKKRIVLLGDSIAFGAFLDDEKRLPDRIEKLLAEHGVPAEVFDLGIPVYAMRQYAASYRLFGNKLDPDTVVIQVEPGDFQDPATIVPSSLEKRIAFLSWMHWRFAHSRDTRETQSAGIAAYRYILRTCSEKGIKVLVLYFPFLIENWRDWDWNETKTFLENEGAQVIDIGAILSSTSRGPIVFRVRPEDLIHPNAEAIDHVARDILDEIIRGLVNKSPALEIHGN